MADKAGFRGGLSAGERNLWQGTGNRLCLDRKHLYFRGVIQIVAPQIVAVMKNRSPICFVLIAAFLLVTAFLAGGDDVYAQTRTPPYWASISADEARMRVGPSYDYPSSWVYRRRDLPVKVLQIHGNWRKVQDESGAQGWMHVRLLSDTKTGIVSADEGHIHKSANDSAALLYRAEKGVVGRLGGCSNGWCEIAIHDKKGFIRASSLWGAVR